VPWMPPFQHRIGTGTNFGLGLGWVGQWRIMFPSNDPNATENYWFPVSSVSWAVLKVQCVVIIQVAS
jgi:hypothetical protein